MTTELLGGYRLVRKLGEGARSEVFLGYPRREDAEAAAAVLKLYRAGVDEESILIEAEALSRAAGEHVVPLLDVTTGRDGAPVLILERVGTTTLARVLGERSQLQAGEAITILAPLLSAVQRMHAAGVVHGGIRADAVLFSSIGAPVLAYFGSATLIPSGLPRATLEQQAGVRADLRSFASLAASVLVLVHDDAAAALGRLLVEAAANEAALTLDWFDSLADRVFGLGGALPVDLAQQERSELGDGLPGRVITASPVIEPEPVRQAVWLQSLLSLASVNTSRTASSTKPLTDGVSLAALSVALGRLRAGLGTVRRRIWLIAGGVGVALVVALIAIPPSGTDARAPAAPPLTSSTAVPGAPARGSESPGAESVVGADDPVAALPVLLEARERCIRDLSVLCLDAVDQEGSSALDDDRALVRSMQGGAELGSPLTADGAVLTERLGDSAIVALGPDSEPASILMMRGEAGWRIRDYLAAPSD